MLLRFRQASYTWRFEASSWGAKAMSGKQVVAVMRYIRNLAVARGDELLPDRQLLERFAYASLLKRHGPMVLSVCRSILHNPHDAEDAFQATFLVWPRKLTRFTA